MDGLIRRNTLIALFSILPVWPAFAESNPEFDQYNIYFGNLHSHTSFSDGSGTPDQAFHYAEEKGHLDFMAITEHNHTNNIFPKDPKGGKIIGNEPSLYVTLIDTAKNDSEDAQFIALFGQEFSSISKGNHLNIFGVKEVVNDHVIENGDYKDLYEKWLPDHPEVQFIQFNHPWNGDRAIDYGLGNYHGSYKKLRDATAKYVRTFEVINGPGLSDGVHRAKLEGEEHYRHYLTHGFKIAAVADQDNHKRTWGTLTDARTGVLSPNLSRDDLLKAIQARRCFATTDKNLRVWYALNTSMMGSDAKTDSRKLKVSYKLEDLDESGAEYDLFLVYGSTQMSGSTVQKKIETFNGDHSGNFEFVTQFSKTFVYLKFVQWPRFSSKKDSVLTAPVWVTLQ